MFGKRFFSFTQKAAPEFWNLDILIDGQPLALSGYDRINGLLVRNNFLADGNEKIAVFNPPGTLSSLCSIIAAGLSSYRNASRMGSRAACNFEPKPGDLVYFNGTIVRFKGWEDGLDGTGKKFILANEDKWNTKTILPASQIGLIHKYSGSRTSPDACDSKSKTVPVQKIIGNILGIFPGEVRLADYNPILICLADQNIVDLLKKTAINGTKFFELFPSVKYAPSGEQRLGKDNKKRSYMMYFTNSLSSADDILRSPAGARMYGFIADAGKALRSASLFSSMVSDYSVKKTWVLGNSNEFATIQKFGKAGFKTWVWTTQDFRNLSGTFRSVQDSNKLSANEISRHFEVLNNAADASFVAEEIAYPAPFTREDHVEIQASINILNKWNKEIQNSIMDEFLVSAIGLLNKLFQIPFPAILLGSGIPWAVDVHLNNLKINAEIISRQISEQENQVITRFMELIAKAVPLFLNYRSKYETVKTYSDIDNCIVVKRPLFITRLEELLSSSVHFPGPLITTQQQHAVPCRDTLVWTYRPNLQQFISGLFVAKKVVFIGYPLQLEEWNCLLGMYDKISEEYGSISSRSEILKIDSGLFESTMQINATSGQLKEFTDLESSFLFPRLFLRLSKSDENNSGIDYIYTKQIAFVGGFTAFFEINRMVRIIDTDNEGIIQKFPNQLVPRDKVVFLKDERDTVFDELVEYYGHKPDIVSLLKLSETWRSALKKYYEEKRLSIQELTALLGSAGLVRTEASIENWLSGKVICPPENNYQPIDAIARVTKDNLLLREKDKIKDAARKVHSMRIKIGRYLARRIVQSAALSHGETEDDPVLANKLDKISSYAEVAEVEAVSSEDVKIAPSLANKLLGIEDF